MSELTGRVAAGAAGLMLLAAAAAGCGGDDSSAADATPRQVEPSLEAQAAAFLEREGTALRRSLRPYLGPEPATAVEPGSAICRRGAAVHSIEDPARHPFACIVRATAESGGLEVEVVLGFVGTELDGRCWRASNERVAVTTSLPELLTPREARHPVNQVAACV